MSRALRENVLALSGAFTKERAELRSRYLESEEFLFAYLAGFTLTNAAKVAHCLSAHIDLFPRGRPLAVLDVGCGPGSATLAASHVLTRARADQDVRFIGIERSGRAIDLAKGLAGSTLPPHHHATWINADLSTALKRLDDDRFDLAVAANVINEQADPVVLCDELLRRARVLLIIEPALKAPTRKLMSLRDHLLRQDAVEIIAPCTHRYPCPMLVSNERDWCHFYVEWNRPRLIEMVDNATGLDHRYLKMAYVVLSSACHSDRPSECEGAEESLAVKTTTARDPSTRVSRSLRMTERALYRIVSAPLRSKGKIELVLCGGNGELKRIRRLDKHASSSNEDFGHAQRGDLVRFTEKERPDECRAADSFAIISAFNR